MKEVRRSIIAKDAIISTNLVQVMNDKCQITKLVKLSNLLKNPPSYPPSIPPFHIPPKPPPIYVVYFYHQDIPTDDQYISRGLAMRSSDYIHWDVYTEKNEWILLNNELIVEICV